MNINFEDYKSSKKKRTCQDYAISFFPSLRKVFQLNSKVLLVDSSTAKRRKRERERGTERESQRERERERERES